MEFKNKIEALTEKIKARDKMISEEATKTALVMPFIQALGYDVFDPSEVVPEYSAGQGVKKEEKVDYAVICDGKPTMLFECKNHGDKLDGHHNQLFRYFTGVAEAKIGILTNGIVYRFFTDLDKENMMDDVPFFEFNLENVKDNALNALKKFKKADFDLDKIVNSANELKYLSLISSKIREELENPSEEFVKFLGKQVYNGKFTQAILDSFMPLTKKAAHQVVNELATDKLESAIKGDESKAEIEVEEVAVEEKLIVTTEEEIEGFLVVKSIIREHCNSDSIQYKDNQNYFAIYYEKQTQPVCRLHFNRAKKYIGLINEDKSEDKVHIETLDDIYSFKNKLIGIVKRYL